MRTRRPAAEHVPADALFRWRLENQIDLRHPLSQLSQRMPWAALEQALSRHFPATAAAGGRPALPVRLIAGLLYLKHAYDLSDAAVCHRWLENPYWQFFTGEVVFQTRLQCAASSLTRWRQRPHAKAGRCAARLGAMRVHASSFGPPRRKVDGVKVLHRGKAKTMTRRQWRWIKRRQAVEPVIGHLPAAALQAQRRPRRCAARAWLRPRLQPALADAPDRVFARLNPGDGMASLERRVPITDEDWCLSGGQGRLII